MLYESLEHTADIGIRLKAKDLKGLFKNAGFALAELSAERISKDKELHNFSVIQSASNVEELFINWLNELLSLSSAEGLIFVDFKINELTPTHLDAVAVGSDAGNFKVNTELKAATYHQLKVEESKSGWTAEVIFDV